MSGEFESKMTTDRSLFRHNTQSVFFISIIRKYIIIGITYFNCTVHYYYLAQRHNV